MSAAKSAGPSPIVAIVLVIAVVVGGGIMLGQAWHRSRVAARVSRVAPSRQPSAEQPPAGLSPEEQAQFALLTARYRPVQPATVPASGPSTGSVAGMIRFARQGQDPEPQPGLRVQLLRTTVHRAAVQSSLAAEGQGWRDLADAYAGDNGDSSSTQSEQSATAGGTEGGSNAAAAANAQAPQADSTGTASDSTQSEDQQFTQQTTAAITRIQSALQAVPSEADTSAALTLLTEVAAFNVPNFDDCVADATVKETRTNDDGKYELKEVPPGDYYLHAVRIGERAFTEWCLPVHVEADGQTVHVDLTNANAAVLQTNR